MKPFIDVSGNAILARLTDGDPLPPDDRRTVPQKRTFDMLYRLQAPRLLRMLTRRVDREEASDLVQDSFVRLVRFFPESADGPDEPEAYLTTIATNLLRNRARSAYHRTMVAQDPDLADCRSTDMTANLEARDMLNRLQAAMLKLSPKTREIFMAHRLEGATYAEIGKRMGLGVKGVEWHMSKAIAALHRAAGHR
ncbi:sigma-70 family RNA polymerase sigma factor [Sphingomonas oligophenolica]|uniref:Sigma-70 family RNA polymerase sigma factor n=1 Tax=Sphingomonas oligophenolica TaxID=301154 RepID=A0ABU9Y3D8_9SPHN